MELFKAIIPESQKIDAVMRADLDSITIDVDDLLHEVLEYSLFGGGKRIRPLLTVLAARLCGGKGGDSLYRLAIAFEYLHVATLLHDDVIDRGENRRGLPSVYFKFGMVPAILAGDFLHARSMALIGNFGGKVSLDIFCEATRGMVDGEFIQLRNLANYNQSVQQYYQGIIGKTALLIGAATEIGCIYGNGTRDERSALKKYGTNLGCAFQIIDDLLDYQGDENQTGKKTGNDLAEGKITLPLIIALNRAEKKEKERIMQVLASREQRKHSLAEVSGLIQQYNGFDDSRKKASELIDEALAHLHCFAGSGANNQAVFILEQLATYVLTRKK